MAHKPRVLFLCTGNSCRSQMAEGFARSLRSDVMESYSAGVEKHGLNPNAVRVMAEVGIDITSQRSQTTADLPVDEFDYVVTVCDNAREKCPWYPAKTKIVHHSFDDPPALAAEIENEKEKMDIYRRVRDEIRSFVETLPEAFGS